MEQSAVQSIKVRGIWSQNAGADNGAGAEIGARSEQPSRIAKEPPGGPWGWRRGQTAHSRQLARGHRQPEQPLIPCPLLRLQN